MTSRLPSTPSVFARLVRKQRNSRKAREDQDEGDTLQEANKQRERAPGGPDPSGEEGQSQSMSFETGSEEI